MAFLTRSRQFIFAKVMGQLPYRQELLVGGRKITRLAQNTSARSDFKRFCDDYAWHDQTR